MLIRLSVILGILVAFLSAARADNIAIDVTPNISFVGGAFEYSYNVTNDALSSVNLFSFVVGGVGPISSDVTPAGWTFDDSSTPGFVIWTSGDQTIDLVPGASAIFGFSDPTSPGQVQFLGFGSDPV